MAATQSSAPATIPSMFEGFLAPPGTVVTAAGDSAPVDLSTAPHRLFLLVLGITEIVEQEAIDVSIFGSTDGKTWGPKALAAFAQQFYAGEYPLLLDLSAQPEVKWLRARWAVSRWGRGSETARFVLGLKVAEVSPEFLK